MDETITISKKTYDRLIEAKKELNRLIANGVDNWEGYSIGLEDEEEDYE